MGVSKAELAKWPEPVPGRCNFRRKNFTRCKARPEQGETRCRKHRRPSGEANGRWRGGTSRAFARQFLPERLLDRFDQVVNDPEISSVRELLAIASVRWSELLEKLETLESRKAWERFGECLDELELKVSELKDKDAQLIRPFLDEMRRHYKSALQEHLVWDQILETMEQHRKLADTEQKREANLQANLTARQSIALFNHLFRVLVEEIPDLEQRRRIGLRINELLNFERALPAEVKSA